MTVKGETLMSEKSGDHIVSNQWEFNVYVKERLPHLLQVAITQTKRCLRESVQWDNDILHEQLAQRWAYALVERFQAARHELPW